MAKEMIGRIGQNF